jgi:capsular exopolysaccharide synthesis family protein
MSNTNDFSPTDAFAADRPARAGAQWYRFKFWARRFWWIIALTIMLGLGVVDVICLRDTPEYVSMARMTVSGRVNIPQGQIFDQGLELANFYGTQVAIMKSPQIVSQAMDRVATLHPEVTPDKDAEVDAVLELRTSIFDLKVTSSDPDYAKLLLDSVMDSYLSSKREWKNQTTDEAVSAITEEISRLDAQIRSDEQELLDFQKTNNVVFIEEQSGSAASYLVSLNNELARLTKDHDLLALVDKDPLAKLPPSAPAENSGVAEESPGQTAADQAKAPDNAIEQNTDVIVAQQDKVEKLKIERDQLGQYLKDAHPKMKKMNEAIDEEQKFLDVLKARNEKDTDQRLEEMQLAMKNLEQQIKIWNDRSLELSQRLGTYQELKSKLTREQALYSQLSASIQNVDLNKSLDQADVVIMEAASTARRIGHLYLLWLLGGAAAGAIVGFIIVLAMVLLDDKINSPLDIEEGIDFPLLGEIPLARLDRKSKRVPLLSDDDERYDFLEHHRDIRSALFFGSSIETRARSLVITSAAPGEGKSTLTANLAATFAFSGISVLLIDADLRRGIQHTIFGVPAKVGLSNYLQGEVPWREVVRNTKIPNLDLLPRGKVMSRAGDLLLTAAADFLIQESLAEYDMVLWDTAPLFAAHDAADLCSRVEGVLFMARVRHSSINLVRAALGDLVQRKARIVGVVLNAVKAGQPGYYSKYRYKEYSSVSG